MKKIVIISSAIILAIITLVSFNSVEEDNIKSIEKEYFDNYKSNYKIYNPPIPEKIDFAGEAVPTEIFYVYENLEREIISNTYWHSNTLLLFKRANRWFSIIEPILKENNIPLDFKYLAVIESGLSQVVSPAGARGFWQIMPQTAKEYNLEVNKEIDERYHIEKSTLAACNYLKDAYEKFGNWTLAAAAYNAGMSGIEREINLQKAQSYYDLSLNSETARYIYRIIAMKSIFSKPSNYGFNLREIDLYPKLKVIETEIDSSYINWAEFSKENNISYNTLKTLNPWLRTKELNNINRKSYTLLLPEEEMTNYSTMKTKQSKKTGIFGDSN